MNGIKEKSIGSTNRSTSDAGDKTKTNMPSSYIHIARDDMNTKTMMKHFDRMKNTNE